MTSTAVYPQTPGLATAILQNSTGAFTFAAASNTTTNLVALVTGSTNGTFVNALWATTTDTSANTLILILNNGTYNLVVSEYNIPLTAGFATAVPPVDLLRNSQTPGMPFDTNQNRYIFVPSGSTLYIGTTTVVTSAKQVSVFAVTEAF